MMPSAALVQAVVTGWFLVAGLAYGSVGLLRAVSARRAVQILTTLYFVVSAVSGTVGAYWTSGDTLSDYSELLFWFAFYALWWPAALVWIVVGGGK